MSGNKITEESSIYTDLDKKSIGQILVEMNEEDKKVALAVEKLIPELTLLIDKLVARMRMGGRVFYVGAGTSGRLAVLDASEIPPTFGVSPQLIQALIAGGDKALRTAVENAEDNLNAAWQELKELGIKKTDSVLGISASGTTPYVLGAIKHAREAGLFTASIACNPDSPIAKEAEIAIEAIVGPEYLTASTRLKAGTAQKMILNMISTTVFIQLGRVRGNKMEHMQLANAKLVDRGVRMIMDETTLKYSQAEELLLKYGSVRKVLETFGK